MRWRTLPATGAQSAAPSRWGAGPISAPGPRGGAPCPGQQGVEEYRSAGSLAWETRGRPPRARSGYWLPFTADSQVPRRNFALHMRRPWLAQWRGWGRRPPGSVQGMAWGSAGKRRPTVSPIHTGRRETPGLHLQPRSRQPLLGPRASRALRRRPRSPLPAPRSPLPALGPGRVVPPVTVTLHSTPAPAPGRWALEPVCSRPPPLPGRDVAL